MENYSEKYNEIMGNLKKIYAETPEQMAAFQGFLHAAEKEGALAKKQKELIAIGCSVVSHCDWCIAYHVKEAIDAGATRQEILEAAWVSVLMGGGPALMYAQGVFKALEDFGK
jgi:AhpD family alkylhydroperoxidase